MSRAQRLEDALLEVGGPAVEGVVLFGSQLLRTSPDRHSAWDFIVIVDDYGVFHTHLVEAGHHRRPPWLLSLLAHVLPPNITAFVPDEDGPVAKCAIVSMRHFAQGLGPRARDHFLKGRMVQKVEIVHARDDGVRERLEHLLARARRDVLSWVGPYLEEPFTGEELARRMLEVSYGGEIRPEAEDRVGQVFEAQREFLARTYSGVLERAAAEGAVERLPGGRYRLAEPPGAMRRLRVSLYFFRSKVRATLRWLKHVLTFNDWLTYVQRKVERRRGIRVEITRWERRLPLLLLWPKVFRVLRSEGEDRNGSLTPGEDS